MTLGLILAQCAAVAKREADAIEDRYAWPPRPELTDEERKEVGRLNALSSRMAYRARSLGQVDQSYDALFGGDVTS